MNLDDLASVLRDRADHLPDAPAGPRVAGVQSLVRASRRRRAVTGALCLALVGALYALVVPTPREGHLPAGPVRAYPDHHQGTRILAQATGRTAVTRFVPRTLDLSLFLRCDKEVVVRVVVDGRDAGLVPCGPGGGSTLPTWADYGVAVGKPSVVAVAIEGRHAPEPPAESGYRLVPAPPDVTAAIAVGEPVPPDTYPFPPRPAELRALRQPHLGTTVLRSDPTDPNLPRQLTWTWPGGGDFRVQSTTPGRLRVLVNDVEVQDHSWWDYEAIGGVAVIPRDTNWQGLEVGQRVTVTVVPERFTGEWMVELPM